MKKITLFVSLLLLFQLVFGQKDTSVQIIPQPVNVVHGTGKFVLDKTVSFINQANDVSLDTAISLFLKQIAVNTGYQLPQQKVMGKGKAIVLTLNKTANASLGNEGYTLNVAPNNIVITANRPAGVFYGLQTLMQMMPAEIYGSSLAKNVKWEIPSVKIVDQPRFGWRGLMFDVSRHFFTKDEVKRFIDDMVKYKYNLLHFHLTDDQGWRLEIKSLPKLTEVGAWRAERKGKWANTPTPDPSEPKTYGGFYTHDDIKELVAYAKARFVNILPEIDIPGHSLAAIAAYPELTCTPGTYQVNAGEKFMDWPGPIALVDNNLCPAKENVYEFLDKVFTEVAQLFPFEYIHMGGDEAAKNMWQKSDLIKDLMKRENLKDMHEVQSYFVKRVEKIILSKGKKMMGWDEILEGGLAPTATVMSWRGMKGGIEAAKMGHKVVMSPSDFAYLDYMQADEVLEHRVYASLRMNKTYQFNPVPEGIDEKLILGGQGNLWTEQIQNMRTVQYMLWPRAMAVAESVWSPAAKKNWANFVERVEAHFPKLDAAQTKYAKAFYDPTVTTTMDANGNLVVKLETEVDGLDIHYSIDETPPDNFYPKYTAPIMLAKDVATLRVITYRDGKPIGREMKLPVAELQRRVRR